MNIWLTVLLVLQLALYIVVRISKPIPIRSSRFELEHQASEGDDKARTLLSRLRAAPFLWSLWWFVGVVLQLGIGATLIGLVGAVGFIMSVLIVIAIAWLQRLKRLRNIGRRLFEKAEPRLQKVYAARNYFFFLPVNTTRTEPRIESEAELLHLLDGSSFLEPERRALIHSALEFTGLTVSDAMSGRRSIKSVDKAEVVGPLVVDELYKTGKTAFVVIDGSLDMVVGILKLERLTSLDLQDVQTAVTAMSPEVHFVDVDAPITDALSYLRSSKAPFLVVQDGDKKTVGLLTMDNILRCLFAS